MEVESVEADGFGRGDWTKAIGGALFFVAGLLVWWELEFAQGLTVSFNAFDYNLTGFVPYVIFVGLAVLTIIIRTGSLHLPAAFAHPVLSLALAAVGTVLVGVRFFMDGWDNSALDASENTINRGIGLYLALAAALVVLAGCVVAYRDERLAGADDDEGASVDATAPEGTRRPASPPLP